MPRGKAPTGPSDEASILASADVVELIGGYPVLRVIGEGSVGRVFACKDPVLGRVVAIKVLKRRAARSPDRLERFRREARAMARISSPHVAALYQVGDNGGIPFLVMEHLEGEDLERGLSKRGRLPAVEALGYARDAALGLKAASAAGILHRDVKPANLIVVGGRAKLTDFGLARLVGDAPGPTRDGVVVGTVAYLAPERVDGEGDDLRADIYSLGATLYALLAGRPPFLRPTPLEVITAHLEEEPDPLERIRSDLPEELPQLIRRMMEKDPARRFQSYDSLIAEMDRVLVAPPPHQLRVGEEEAFVDEPTEAYDIPAPVDVGAPSRGEAPPPEESALVPQPTGVLGNLRQMTLAEIAQMLELGHKSARVELVPAQAEAGEVAFDGGRLVYARAGALTGPEAFYALASCREGFFRIHYDRTSDEINVDVPLGFLMLEAMRRLDEANAASVPEAEGDDTHELPQLPPSTKPSGTGELERVPTTSVEVHDTLPEGPPASGADADPAAIEKTVLEPLPDRDSTTEQVRTRRKNKGGQPDPQAPGPSLFERAGTVLTTVGGAVEERAEALLERVRSSEVASQLREQVGGFVRARPVVAGAAIAAPVVVLLVVLVVAALAREDEEEILRRIDSGEATQVLLDLSRVPASERSGTEELLRGHALARLDRTEEAVQAYHAAVRRGAADERALELVLSRLEREEPSAELDTLIEWPGAEVRARLMVLVKDQRWWVRQNALVVLEGRGEASAVDREAFAIQDLLTGPDCLDRRQGLLALRAVGKSERAREALKEAARRGRENLCMERELREMMPQVELR